MRGSGRLGRSVVVGLASQVVPRLDDYAGKRYLLERESRKTWVPPRSALRCMACRCACGAACWRRRAREHADCMPTGLQDLSWKSLLIA